MLIKYHLENPKDVTRKLLELMNKFGKVARYKFNTLNTFNIEMSYISIH